MADKIVNETVAQMQSSLHPVHTVTSIKHKVRVLDGVKVSYSSWVKLFQLHARGYDVLHHIDRIRPLELGNRGDVVWN
ncbi:hypothetical protein E3N88_06595 [Mikania micrantha]|uniref:Uncharacterized protein n=1 Tax=Mikania micrantha TaxID=192012 RepID=A0A5N6PS28_9ASTR|nr:hypothetical protein E3N88_06595 [Mikania micrantha]